AHGTGTILGDPIEVSALTEAFKLHTDRRGFCGIGSVKSNFGHLSCAAGVAGLIKTVLMLERGAIPPTVHYQAPNPAIDLASSPFYVTTSLQAWERNGMPRRAGVSSFGVGGTNAHLVVEETPEVPEPEERRPHQLIVLSARTPEALDDATTRVATHLESHPTLDLADVAFTLRAGRRAFRHRRLVVTGADDTAGAIAALREPGLPALCTVEYALAELWRSWGIQPAAMIGHSVGEFVAAALAGVMTLDDALALVARRGQLISALPRGSMLAVMAPADELEPFVDGEVSLAAVNAPAPSVLSGPPAAIKRVEALLGSREIAARRQHTSHAFHSSMMDPILAEFEALVMAVS